MADLVGGGGLAAPSNGNGMAAPRRPTGAPAPTGSPSGIRGPRMIMQERAAREARQKAEAEKQQMERARAEQEARLQEEAQRNLAERRAAGVATGQSSGTGSQHYVDSQRQSHAAETTQPAVTQPAVAAPSTPQQQSHHRTNSSRFATNQQLPPSQVYSTQQTSQNPQMPPQPQPQPQQQTQPQTQTQTQTQTHARPHQPQQHPSMPAQAGESATQPTSATGAAASSKPRSSFPHAFERWETLSAHWEGLTSYWIRKLEQNKDELNRDPLNQQLGRQVTDLSAAGANLFHAVVELQRLRASSERKFQRWFFETRAELERAQEVNSMLEHALDDERRNRDEAIREALEKDQGSSLAQKQVAEMRKELDISKNEARRAWEELGRREQAERDRTLSLQSGHPTIVGGVQVVPMTHGAPGRQQSTRDPVPYQSGYSQGYPPEQVQSPSTQAPPPAPAPAPPTATSSGGGQYRQQEAPQAQAGGYAGGGLGGEYLTDLQGNFQLDTYGRKIPRAGPPSSCSGSDEEAEAYDTPATTNPPSGSYDPPSSSAPDGQWTGAYSDPQDYAGEGYAAPGWETVPRHHHPTRLSDVIEEEDERSRTSTSQISRG